MSSQPILKKAKFCFCLENAKPGNPDIQAGGLCSVCHARIDFLAYRYS